MKSRSVGNDVTQMGVSISSDDKNEWTNERMKERMNEWMNEWKNEWKNERMNKWLNESWLKFILLGFQNWSSTWMRQQQCMEL